MKIARYLSDILFYTSHRWFVWLAQGPILVHLRGSRLSNVSSAVSGSGVFTTLRSEDTEPGLESDEAHHTSQLSQQTRNSSESEAWLKCPR